MRLEGEMTSYVSLDSIDDGTAEDSDNYPIKFLNGLEPAGMPLHKLNLKIGAIIMLLRNLNTKRGLCNGSRLIVVELRLNLVIAKVITGSAAGQWIFIPRIDLAPSNTELPFVLRRRQFPIRLAFAMTINKSQRKTLEKVGVYLPEPVFAHGQLYVALSRAKRAADVRVKIVTGQMQGQLKSGAWKTRNVVYREVLCSIIHMIQKSVP